MASKAIEGVSAYDYTGQATDVSEGVVAMKDGLIKIDFSIVTDPPCDIDTEYDDGPISRLCNYCTFQGLKSRAKSEGKEVTVVPSTGSLGGVEVYLHPKGVVIQRGADSNVHPQHAYWVRWFMELPDHCCC